MNELDTPSRSCSARQSNCQAMLQHWPERSWAVENAEGFGHHLALWLVSKGETVVDVAPAATARVRQLPRGGRRKNDRIDTAAASMPCTGLPGRCRRKRVPIRSLYSMNDGKFCPLKGLAANQLRALQRELLPGGAPTGLTATKAAAVLRGLRPDTGPDHVRKSLAKDLVADIKRYRRQS